MLELQAASPDDVPPVIVTPHHYLINIYRSSIYLVAVVTKEGNACICTAWLYLNFVDDNRLMFIAIDFFAVPPLFVVEFLHHILNLFDDYFHECNESTIKENYVIVYEVSIYLYALVKKSSEMLM